MYLSEFIDHLNNAYQPSSNDDFELFMSDGLPVTALQVDRRNGRIYISDDPKSKGLLKVFNTRKSKANKGHRERE